MATPAAPLSAVPAGSTPLKEIPGGYGLPFLGPIKDRLDFFWFQGEREFWASRLKKYKSTVFRTNVPPSPPTFSANNVIMLLDQKSFPILFDTDKVYKKDVLLANYMPSTSFYGGIRPCVYLDPSEERHAKIKAFMLDLMNAAASKWIPETERAVSEAFSTWESTLAKDGKVGINAAASKIALDVFGRTIYGKDPTEGGLTSLEITAWLAPQLLPVTSSGVSNLLDALVLHKIRFPFFLVSSFYKKMENYVRENGGALLDAAEKKYGIEREDALHNLIFTTAFNAIGGLEILLPSVLGYVGEAGEEMQARIREEVRSAVKSEGGKLTPGAVRKMPLVRSAVYEVLRMSPPVPYQYGVAKTDLVIESHDARFEVKKGEILGGCQPFAVRDPVIFEQPDVFKADRFFGSQGEKLIRHVLWSNGFETSQPTTSNKQCPGHDVVPLVAQILLATVFRRYDAFVTIAPKPKVTATAYYFTSITKSSSSD